MVGLQGFHVLVWSWALPAQIQRGETFLSWTWIRSGMCPADGEEKGLAFLWNTQTPVQLNWTRIFSWESSVQLAVFLPFWVDPGKAVLHPWGSLGTCPRLGFPLFPGEIWDCKWLVLFSLTVAKSVWCVSCIKTSYLQDWAKDQISSNIPDL